MGCDIFLTLNTEQVWFLNSVYCGLNTFSFLKYMHGIINLRGPCSNQHGFLTPWPESKSGWTELEAHCNIHV